MIRVLIVDDEDLSRYALRKMFSLLLPNCLIVGEAENGKEAERLALELDVSLILMDIRMPIVDGLEASRAILEKNPNINIIITSAHDDFSYAQKAVNMGLSGYLLKPIREKDFLSLLTSVLFKIENNNSINQNKKRPSLLCNQSENTTFNINVNISSSKIIESIYKSIRIGDIQDLDNNIKYLFLIWEKEYKNIISLKEVVLEFVIHTRKEFGTFNDITDSINVLDTVNAFSYSEDLFKWLKDFINKYSNRIQYESKDIISRVKKYVMESDPSKITLEIVADAMHISPPYLSRIFKNLSGIGFVDFLTQVRMEQAKILLASTNHSVNEIGKMLGYSDPGYFSKIFKEFTGVTPGNYRRMNGKV